MQNKANFESVKFLKNIAKINISKNFIEKNNLKIKNSGPIDSTTKHKLQQLLTQNEKIKNIISEPSIIAETVKIDKENFSVFFSTPTETKTTSKTANCKLKNTEKIAIVAKFANLNALKFFCGNIMQTYKKIWLTSELHKLNKLALILIVHTKKEAENDLSALLVEFNATIEKGKFQEAIAREHCQKIFEKQAIEKISLID